MLSIGFMCGLFSRPHSSSTLAFHVFKTITYCSSNTSFLQCESVGMCFAGYGDRGDMITQEDTVFVSGMSPALTEDDIQQHFGAIGVIKVSTPSVLSQVLWVLGFS